MYPFERFNEDSKRVLVLAQREAEASGHTYIGSEHILIALLHQPGTAQRVLRSLGVEEASVREATKNMIGRTERIALHDLVPTTRVKKIIELSFSEASRLKSDRVDSGHILLGLIAEGGSVGAEVLKSLGATPDRLLPAIAVELGVPVEPEPAAAGIDAARYRDVMSAFPSGVVIVTAYGDDGLPRGLTVNAFSAVSLNPPLALVCIDKTSNTLPAVQHTHGFTANILAAGREALARRMATKLSDKFDGLEWRRSEAGAGGPILVADSVAYAVCTLKDTVDAGDHWILIGTVVDGAHLADVQPMLYSRRQYRAL